MTQESSRKLSRRDILKLGVASGTAYFLPDFQQNSDWLPPVEFTSGNHALPITRVETDHPYVSLTYDDGYFPELVEQFLRAAESAGLVFTLFPVGAAMTNDPEIWRAVKLAGHEIGNHSHSHHDVSTMTLSEIRRDFRRFEEEDYPEVFGEPFPTPGFARVPVAQGPVNGDVQQVIYELEDLHVHWRVDSYSWRRVGMDPDVLVNSISKAEAGDIIVLHLREMDIELLPRYLEALAAKGLQHVPFSTLWETRRQPEPEPEATEPVTRRSFLAAPFLKPINHTRRLDLSETVSNHEGIDRPDIVFGAYFPYHLLATPRKVTEFQNYILNNGVNSVIIDIKNEAGRVNVPFEHPNKPKIYPDYLDDPANVRSFLDWANANNVYVIGRQVIMSDTRFANANSRLALHSANGGLWSGMGRGWANPFASEVADYNATITRAAADFGIREIMYDYVRFPSADMDTNTLVLSGDTSEEGRVAAITNIIRTAHDRLSDTNSMLSAAFFGYTAWDYQGDMGIGQSLEAVAAHLDNFCPMAYPDLYGSGIIDCDNFCRPAPQYPYEILYHTVNRCRERLMAINPNILVTPWIQAYQNINHGVPFSLEDIDLQLRGAFAAGADGVLAWNPVLEYPEGMFPEYPEDLYI